MLFLSHYGKWNTAVKRKCNYSISYVRKYKFLQKVWQGNSLPKCILLYTQPLEGHFPPSVHNNVISPNEVILTYESNNSIKLGPIWAFQKNESKQSLKEIIFMQAIKKFPSNIMLIGSILKFQELIMCSRWAA